MCVRTAVELWGIFECRDYACCCKLQDKQAGAGSTLSDPLLSLEPEPEPESLSLFVEPESPEHRPHLLVKNARKRSDNQLEGSE